MKLFKILISLSLLFSMIGCKKQNNTTQSSEINISSYEYPDEFFNYNFTKDNQDNYYFLAGMNYYQFDQQNNLKKIFYRLIDNQYYVYDAKYYNDKIYLLVLKVNHQHENSPLGLATIDLDGNHFQYLNDLIYSNNESSIDESVALQADISKFRIYEDKIYLLDLYDDNPSMYIYSLETESIDDYQITDIYKDRTEFYKKEYTDYPYNQIQHIYDSSFYTTDSSNNEKKLIKYNPSDNTEVEYDLTKYYDISKKNIEFYLDLLDDRWFLFSNQGVFVFDINFENEYKLLDDSIFDNAFSITIDNNI